MKQLLKLLLVYFLTPGISAAQTAVNTSELYSFSPDGMECVVFKSDLPRPWLNRLSNDVFFTWVTHNGYIESYLLDPVLNGLVNPQNVSGHFYVRDNQSGNFFLMNESDGDDAWQSAIGLGYTTLSRKKDGLDTELTYFIPRNDNVLLAILTIRNSSSRARDLAVFGQVEWNLGDRVKTITYESNGVGGSQHNLYKKVKVENNVMYAEQNNWKSTATCIPWPYTGYFSASEPVVSFETLQQNFTGPRRRWDNPVAIANGTCSNTEFSNFDEYPLGVLHVNVSLPPGESKEIVYMLGMEKNRNDIAAIVQKYKDPSRSKTELERTKSYYRDFLAKTVKVETPDKRNDRIINIWSQYHWRQGLKKELDTDTRGSGFWAYGLEADRVGLHPEYVLVPLDTSVLKQAILNILLRNQTPGTDGTALFSSPSAMLNSDIGETWPPGNIRGHFKVPHHHQIYIFLFSIYYYLLETGDLQLLREVVPYIDGTQATVFKHIESALAISVKGLNERGFPRIPQGVGDWMDEFTQISRKGEAESVMLAMELGFILKRYSEIATSINAHAAADQWMSIYKRIQRAVNEHAWDGEWYITAFADSGQNPQPVGSNKNEEGKIYINPQAWAILSEMATPERADKALAAVKKYLSSDYGALVFWPSYKRYVDYVGTQSLYSPGFRNANIYLRPAGWAVIAAAMTGKPELAYELYQSSSLAQRSRDIDAYMLEPYVYPENYVGPDHMFKGQGQFHWCFGEGTAWMWYAYVNHILGVRAELDGLRIDPKIPADWKGYKVTRPFRGSVYNIEVKNPENKTMGVKWIKVDGRKIRGTLIQPHSDNQTHKVEVLMGS